MAKPTIIPPMDLTPEELARRLMQPPKDKPKPDNQGDMDH